MPCMCGCLRRPEEGAGSLGLELQVVVTVSHLVWVLGNYGPRKEQQVLFSESSLQSHSQLRNQPNKATWALGIACLPSCIEDSTLPNELPQLMRRVTSGFKQGWNGKLSHSVLSSDCVRHAAGFGVLTLLSLSGLPPFFQAPGFPGFSLSCSSSLNYSLLSSCPSPSPVQMLSSS